MTNNEKNGNRILEMWKSKELISYLLILLVFGLFIRLQPAIHRPFHSDEMVTLSKYAGAPYVTMDQLRRVPSLNWHRALKGVVKCFANNWNPNNHIVNSLLISISNYFFGFSEWACRFPALVASLLLVLLANCWIYHKSGSPKLAFLCGLLLLLHPYFVYYGQCARGYAITALLVFVQIALVDFLRSRGSLLTTSLLLGLVGLGLFLNLASLLFAWLLPLYLLGWVELDQRALTTGQHLSFWERFGKNEKYRAWLLQFVIVASGIGLFVITNFKLLLTAQDKFGYEAQSINEVVVQIASLLFYLLPGCWWSIGILGLTGWIIMLRRKTFHWLGLVSLASIVTNLVYVLISGKMPYPRTFGYYLVLLVAGVAWLWRAVSEKEGWRLTRIIRSGILCVLSLVVVTSIPPIFKRSTLETDAFSEMAVMIKSRVMTNHESPDQILVLLPWCWGGVMRFYLPPDADYITLSESKKDRIWVYLAGVQKDGKDYFLTQPFVRPKPPHIYPEQYWRIPPQWQSVRFVATNNACVYRVPFRVIRQFPGSDEGDAPLIVVWNNVDPHFNLSAYFYEHLKQDSALWGRNLSLNLIDYVSATSLGSLNLLIANEAELNLVKKIVNDLQSKSTGELFVLKPAF